MKPPVSVVGLLAVCASQGWAQVDTGTMLGTVRDQAEAVVPGGKLLPASRLNANAIKLLYLYPVPNVAGLLSNFATDHGDAR